MTENRRPDRPSDKTDEEDPECLQDSDERVGAGKEELAEDQPRHLSVKQEIVPLDRCADGASNNSTAQLSAMLVFGDVGSTDLGSGHGISSCSSVRFPPMRGKHLRSPVFPGDRIGRIVSSKLRCNSELQPSEGPLRIECSDQIHCDGKVCEGRTRRLIASPRTAAVGAVATSSCGRSERVLFAPELTFV